MISGKILSLSRLELPTLRLSGVYSNQLSYKLFIKKIKQYRPTNIRLQIKITKLRQQNANTKLLLQIQNDEYL